MGENRRKSKRIPMRVEAKMEWESRKYRCRITNLSLGGCFVESYEPIRKGEIISLLLPLTYGQWLQVSAELIHVFLNGFGTRFVGLTDKEQVLLHEFILRHGKNPTVQPARAAAQETEQTINTAEQKSISEIKENRKPSEFERFIEDLMGDIE